MNHIKERWQQRTPLEKAVFIVGMLCSVSVIILACLQLFNVWEDAAYAYMPLCALLMLIQAFENRKKNRRVLFISLGAAALIAVVWVLVLVGL